jgi:hypothetical protein
MLRRKYRVLESNNNDKKNAVAKFFGISPNSVKVSTVSGYDGPVTEAVVDGNTFWVLTEDEAYREATASFLDTFDRGSMIEKDSYLKSIGNSTPFDLDRVAEYYCDYMNDVDDDGDERSYDEIREDEYELERWADETFSLEELWDNGLIDKDQFCNNIWDMDGVGLELDMEQRTEDINWNGETLYIILREGEWMDPKNESRRRRCSRLR